MGNKHHQLLSAPRVIGSAATLKIATTTTFVSSSRSRAMVAARLTVHLYFGLYRDGFLATVCRAHGPLPMVTRLRHSGSNLRASGDVCPLRERLSMSMLRTLQNHCTSGLDDAGTPGQQLGCCCFSPQVRMRVWRPACELVEHVAALQCTTASGLCSQALLCSWARHSSSNATPWTLVCHGGLMDNAFAVAAITQVISLRSSVLFGTMILLILIAREGCGCRCATSMFFACAERSEPDTGMRAKTG